MLRPLLLDLFCGAGGAAMGYHRAGFDVVGVDIKPQPNYPFEFIQYDATWYPTDDFDAVHASPPCQSNLRGLSAVNRKLGRKYEHEDLLAWTRERLIASGLPYLIEQPEQGAPMIDPVRLCGTAFNRPLRRHRLFESNVALVGKACAHASFTEQKYWTSWRPAKQLRLATTVQIYGNAGGRHEWPAALGVDWMTPEEMTQAIPPDYTEFLGRQLLSHINAKAAA